LKPAPTPAEEAGDRPNAWSRAAEVNAALQIGIMGRHRLGSEGQDSGAAGWLPHWGYTLSRGV